MPELVTHASVGYFARRWLRKTDLSIVLLGSILPDVCTRIPNFVFNWLDIAGGEDLIRPLHAPFPLLLVALLLSYFFAESVRKRVFVSLCIGIATHLVLDMLQKRAPETGIQLVHERGYQWFFPFSQFDFQIGLFSPEDSLYAVPVLLLIVGWLAWRDHRRSAA